MRILLTGFEPFGKLQDNPSRQLLAQLSAADFAGDVELICECLPTAYARSALRIRQLLDELQPDLCICLGVAQNRRQVCLERIAMNLDDCSLADNDGELVRGREVVAGAELALKCELALEDILAADEEEATADESACAEPGLLISNHAGNFVCNHLYFHALQHIASHKLSTRCVFLHVPMTEECRGAQEEYSWQLPSQEQLRATVARLAARIAASLSPGSQPD